MKTALIVDPDLAFGFWLARGLDQAGYQGYPAKTVGDAIALLEDLHLEASLLIVDPALPDSAGLIERLRESNQQMRVVALIGGPAGLPAVAARVDLCCRKPQMPDEVKRGEWIAHIEQLLPASLLGAVLDNSALLRKCAAALKRQSRSTVPIQWSAWEGRVIDRRFALGRHLGGCARNALFLTTCPGGGPAAIRVVPADSAERDVLLARWERAAGLSHPGLIRLLEMGRSESEGAGLAYLVMEYAEENLAEVLRQRPLSPVEVREMLDPVLDALGYLHGRGLVHGHVKPSNILAASDRLKLSSDWLRAVSEPDAAAEDPGVYDAPEAHGGFLSPAADVWSLGITLVEALTQRPLAPKRLHKAPALPVTLPRLFLDIAHDCLNPDPQQRKTAGHLAERLREASVAEDPSPVPRTSRRGPWWYAVPMFAAAAALSGMFLRPPHRATTTATPPPVAIRQSAPAPPVPRHLIQQPVPDVSSAALHTIEGTIEVRVRVHVNPSGSVADAVVETPGPSRYFADRALEAARYCRFDPGTGEDWKLRFDFTADGTQVSSERASR